MQRQALPLPLTWLHQLEFRNALRLPVFRGEITPPQRDASLNALLADVAAGVLAAAVPPLAETPTEAERLSALHAETTGTRSLDVLHVSSALVLGLAEFLTLDHRQPALAKATGLSLHREAHGRRPGADADVRGQAASGGVGDGSGPEGPVRPAGGDPRQPSETHTTVPRIRDVRSQARDLSQRADRPGRGGDLGAKATAFADKVTAIEEKLTNPQIKDQRGRSQLRAEARPRLHGSGLLSRSSRRPLPRPVPEAPAPVPRAPGRSSAGRGRVPASPR